MNDLCLYRVLWFGEQWNSKGNLSFDFFSGMTTVKTQTVEAISTENNENKLCDYSYTI